MAKVGNKKHGKQSKILGATGEWLFSVAALYAAIPLIATPDSVLDAPGVDFWAGHLLRNAGYDTLVPVEVKASVHNSNGRRFDLRHMTRRQREVMLGLGGVAAFVLLETQPKRGYPLEASVWVQRFTELRNREGKIIASLPHRLLQDMTYPLASIYLEKTPEFHELHKAFSMLEVRIFDEGLDFFNRIIATRYNVVQVMRV